jgi:hypothetical protein
VNRCRFRRAKDFKKVLVQLSKAVRSDFDHRNTVPRSVLKIKQIFIYSTKEAKFSGKVHTSVKVPFFQMRKIGEKSFSL